MLTHPGILVYTIHIWIYGDDTTPLSSPLWREFHTPRLNNYESNEEYNMLESEHNWIQNRVTESVQVPKSPKILIEEFSCKGASVKNIVSKLGWACSRTLGVASRRRTIELRRRTINVGVLLPFTGGLEVGHALKERRISRNRDAFSIFCSDHRPFGLEESPRYQVIRCVTFFFVSSLLTSTMCPLWWPTV